MYNNTSFSSSAMSRWLGKAILIPTLLQIVLAIVSIVFSFVWPLYTEPTFNIGIGMFLFFPLLSTVTVGYFFLKPSVLSRSRLAGVSSLIGLMLGGIFGVVVMLPGQDLGSCPGFSLIMLFLVPLFVPGLFLELLNGEHIPIYQVAVPLSLALLTLLVYAGIAWWVTRRTGRWVYGLWNTLLAALLTSVTTSAVAALIRYLPLLWSPHQVTPMCFYGDGAGLPAFKYYYDFLNSTMYPLFSQLVLACAIGLLGGAFQSWRRARTHSKLDCSHLTTP